MANAVDPIEAAAEAMWEEYRRHIGVPTPAWEELVGYVDEPGSVFINAMVEQRELTRRQVRAAFDIFRKKEKRNA